VSAALGGHHLSAHLTGAQLHLCLDQTPLDAFGALELEVKVLASARGFMGESTA
jgi:hypothetical protein